MHTMRVSDETLDLMSKKAKPFESKDECLKRILSENPCKTKESEAEQTDLVESEN